MCTKKRKTTINPDLVLGAVEFSNTDVDNNHNFGAFNNEPKPKSTA